MRPVKLTDIEFNEKLKSVGLNLIVLDKYMGRFKKIRVQDELGIIYLSNPDKLFEGKRPSLFTAIDKNKAFTIKAVRVHGDMYNYSESIYIDDRTKLKIKCPIHGYFCQIPSSHLQGTGCPKCGIEKTKHKRLKNGWGKREWVQFCKDKNIDNPQLYVINCFNNEEQFIKIGITNREIKGRFWKTNMPYNYTVINTVRDSPSNIYDMEKQLKSLFADFKYYPQRNFHGKTECYSELIKESMELRTLGKGVE